MLVLVYSWCGAMRAAPHPGKNHARELSAARIQAATLPAYTAVSVCHVLVIDASGHEVVILGLAYFVAAERSPAVR